MPATAIAAGSAAASRRASPSASHAKSLQTSERRSRGSTQPRSPWEQARLQQVHRRHETDVVVDRVRPRSTGPLGQPVAQLLRCQEGAALPAQAAAASAAQGAQVCRHGGRGGAMRGRIVAGRRWRPVVGFERHQVRAQVLDAGRVRRPDLLGMVLQPEHRRRGQSRHVPGRRGGFAHRVDIRGTTLSRDGLGAESTAFHRVADVAAHARQRRQRPSAPDAGTRPVHSEGEGRLGRAHRGIVATRPPECHGARQAWRTPPYHHHRRLQPRQRGAGARRREGRPGRLRPAVPGQPGPGGAHEDRARDRAPAPRRFRARSGYMRMARSAHRHAVPIRPPTA